MVLETEHKITLPEAASFARRCTTNAVCISITYDVHALTDSRYVGAQLTGKIICTHDRWCMVASSHPERCMHRPAGRDLGPPDDGFPL